MKTTYLIYVFHAFDTACCLYIYVALVLPQKPRIVWYNPLAIYISVELIVAFDPFKYWSIGWPFVLGITISIHLCFLTVGKWKLFGALSSGLGMMHTRAIRIKVATWSMDHVLAYKLVKFWIRRFVWNFT
jgi:hypothetical protein